MGSLRRSSRGMQSGGELILIGIGLIALHDILKGMSAETSGVAGPYTWLILAIQAMYMSGMLFLLLGIIKLMKTATRLGNSEGRFHSLARVAADAIITIDENSTILSFNQRAERMFGRPAETMIGGKLHAIIPAPLPTPARRRCGGHRQERWRSLRWPDQGVSCVAQGWPRISHRAYRGDLG